MLERIVRLETILESLPKSVEKIDARLRNVENRMWFGIGALAALQIILSLWS